MLRVGLTGGIGSGKTMVATRLAELGAVVIDSDRIAREVVAPGTPGLAEVVAEFGPAVLAEDGSLDRPALAAIVFTDDAARARLNAIVHPLVGARTAELANAALGSAEDVVLVHDVPLLVENGLAPMYHLVLVVDAPVEERVRRLVGSRGMPEADARARIAAQADEPRRRAVADVWLDNSGTPEAVLAEVDALWADRLVPFERNIRLREWTARGGPELVPYDPTWPAQARRVLARLKLAAGGKALRVDHTGSTSVPGLAAKDVLDFQVTVASLADADALAEPLAAAGFPLVPAFDSDTPHGPDQDPASWRKRVHCGADPARWSNVHLRVQGSTAWRETLLFRDWLRANDDIRDEYLAMKRRVAAEFADQEIPDYALGKVPWFLTAFDRMADWAERTGWQP